MLVKPVKVEEVLWLLDINNQMIIQGKVGKVGHKYIHVLARLLERGRVYFKFYLDGKGYGKKEEGVELFHTEEECREKGERIK